MVLMALGLVLFTPLPAVAAPASEPATQPPRQALMARGWRPFMVLAGPQASRRQSLDLLHDGLHLFQTMLMSTVLAPQIERIAADIWASLEDFDLGNLYALLPDKQGGWRSLTFVGRLVDGQYKVRRIPTAHWSTTQLTTFGQMKALVSMHPAEDPRGTRYNTVMRWYAHTGPVPWGGFLKAVRLGLTHLSHPAPWPAPAAARAGVAAANPGLTAAEQRILAQLWAAFPETANWLATIGVVRDLFARYDSAADARHMHIKLALRTDALSRRYPRVAAYLEQLGDFLTARLVIRNRQGHWLTVTLDTQDQVVTLDFWLHDGLLVPSRGGRPMRAVLEPGYPATAQWRALLTLNLHAYGVNVIIHDLQTDWQYTRLNRGAVFIGRLTYVPEVDVSGRLLGILPTSWFEGRLPVSIEGTVDDFMQVLASSNNGQGAKFVVRYDAVASGHVLKVGADWDGLDNFFVRFGVGMVSDRVLPDVEQARGLQTLFHDLLLAWGRDLQKWTTVAARLTD